MKISKSISVALLTYNRLFELKRCLDSLIKQTIRPCEVLVFDNSTNHSARSLINKYSKLISLRYIPTKTHRSVAQSRNIAIEVCKTPYLAFIDDDCVADHKWLETGLKHMLSNPKLGFLVGFSDVLNKYNLVAIAEFCHYRYWNDNEIRIKKRTTALNIDTKNLFLNLKQLPIKVRFNDFFSIGSIDSSDTDFGFQLDKEKIVGRSFRDVKVAHQEIEKFMVYLRKKYIKGKLAAMISKKWLLTNDFVDPVNRYWWPYLKSLRHIKSEWKRYIKYSPSNSFIFNIGVLITIKIQQKLFTSGFYA